MSILPILLVSQTPFNSMEKFFQDQKIDSRLENSILWELTSMELESYAAKQTYYQDKRISYAFPPEQASINHLQQIQMSEEENIRMTVIDVICCFKDYFFDIIMFLPRLCCCCCWCQRSSKNEESEKLLKVSYGLIDFRPCYVTHILVPEEISKTEDYIGMILAKYQDGVENMTAVRTYIDIEYTDNKVAERVTLKMLAFIFFFVYPLFHCIFVKHTVAEYSSYLTIAAFCILLFAVFEFI